MMRVVFFCALFCDFDGTLNQKKCNQVHLLREFSQQYAGFSSQFQTTLAISVLRQEPFPTKVFRCKNSFSWEGFCTKDAV